MRYVLLIIFIFLIQSQSFSQSLFASDSIIHFQINCDLEELLNDRGENNKYHDALFRFNNNSYTVKLKTRGIYRLKKENCFLPPIHVKLDKNQMHGTLFENYKKIKLVLPCYNKTNYEQYILKEYLAYKIYNILTAYSFNVRLIKLTVVDLDNKYDSIDCYAFFIEPFKNLCKRVSGYPLDVKNIHPNFTNTEMITLMSVFQYMIGNTDWSVKALHNIKLISFEKSQKPIAVPYDFDQSGLVNAAYALPAEHLNIQSVKTRVYNGFYQPIEVLQPVLDIFFQNKEKIYQAVYSVQGLKKRYIDETIKYFDQFYKTIDHPKKFKYELIQKSRK
ncbi:MAG: hypothetical protein L3J74_00725 [Bacteroidales bacterium]|nr:hypothetical protein [Bacteroidales bacterium]